MALLFAGSMWFYVQHVLIPHQQSESERYGVPRGNLSDLYPRWLGARELLLHGRDPYSAEVTREIQAGYYGRPLDPARPHDPRDEQGFAYPAYVVFVLAPTVGLPFAVVQTGFRWFLVGLTAASVLLWLRVLGWKASAEMKAILIVLTIGSFPVLQGIKLQQLSLLVAGLIAASAMLLAEGHLAMAGVLLAFATIKPQLALPIAAWLLVWAGSDWPRRRGFGWGFAATMALLVSGAEYLLPGWIGRFRQAVVAYRQYNQGANSVLDVLITPQWGRLLAIAMVLVLVWVTWRHRDAAAGSGAHNCITVLILAATIVVMPKAALYNQVFLLPGIVLGLQQGRRLWSRSTVRRGVLGICGLMLFWPWLAALALLVASLFLPAESVQRAWLWPLYTSTGIPVAVLGWLACSFSQVAESP